MFKKYGLIKSNWGQKRKMRKLKSCLYDLHKAGAIIVNENTAIHTYCATYTKGEFIDNWKKEQIENYLNKPGCLLSDNGKIVRGGH